MKRCGWVVPGGLLSWVVASLVGCGPAEVLPATPSPPPPASGASVVATPAPCGLPSGESTVLTAPQREKLLAMAKATDTTSLVVVENGRITLEVGEPTKVVELMSVTKSVVSLVMGLAVGDGKLRMDQPAADFVPAWKDTPKAGITVEHLLAQTSGLHDENTTERIYASSDFVKFALDSELEAPLGKRFRYSNRTANLLPHIAAVATGQPFEVYAQSRLFEPLGIVDAKWSRDPAGNTQGMAGLSMIRSGSCGSAPQSSVVSSVGRSALARPRPPSPLRLHLRVERSGARSPS